MAGLVLVLCLIFGDAAWAEPPVSTDSTESDVIKNAVQLVSLGIKTINVFLWPFLIIIGDLMDSDLIIGPGMESRLLTIWVQIRNLVNIAFVLVLLVVAFYNVLGIGGGEGNLAIKTALPKLVLGLVLVNFTFVGGKVVLDITNVATTAAFALPELVDGYNFNDERNEFAQSVCYKKYVGAPAPDADGDVVDSNQYWNETDARVYVRPFCKLGEVVVKDTKNKEVKQYTGELNEFASATYFTELNANNIGLVMAVNMGALESLGILDSDNIENFSDLAVSTVFSLVMYVVFAISYVVLGVLLLTRVVVLWLALALSPVTVLVFVVPEIKEWAGGAGDIQNKVVKHLISPIIVGLTLTLGYLMISAWGGVARGSANDASIKFNELMAEEFLMSGIDDLPQFMIAIASIVIVWVGVFAAADGTFAESITGGIKEFGEKIGGTLAKAPLTLPTIPTFNREDGSTTPVSFMAVSKLLNEGTEYMQYGQVQDQINKLSDANPWLKKVTGRSGYGSPTRSAANAKDTFNDAKDNGFTNSDLKSVANDLMTLVKASSLDSKDQGKLNEILRTVEKGGTRGLDALKGLKTNELMDQVLDKHSDVKSSWDGVTNWKMREEAPAPEPEAPAPAPAPEAPATPTKIEVTLAADAKAGETKLTEAPFSKVKTHVGEMTTAMEGGKHAEADAAYAKAKAEFDKLDASTTDGHAEVKAYLDAHKKAIDAAKPSTE